MKVNFGFEIVTWSMSHLRGAFHWKILIIYVNMPFLGMTRLHKASLRGGEYKYLRLRFWVVWYRIYVLASLGYEQSKDWHGWEKGVIKYQSHLFSPPNTGQEWMPTCGNNLFHSTRELRLDDGTDLSNFQTSVKPSRLVGLSFSWSCEK